MILKLISTNLKIKYKNDKYSLNLCSDRLLNDANFIYNVMQIFKNDKLFCISLANKFILNNVHIYNINVINVALLARDIDHGCYLDGLDPIVNYLQKVYNTIKTKPEKIVNKICDFNFNFELVQNNFSTNYLFLEFMASKMLKELYYNTIDENLEYYVKSKFKSPKYIENMGIVQYILSIIRNYDESLADYVEFHQGLIQNKVIELTNIIEDWKIQLYSVEEEVYKYILNYSEEHPEVELDTYIKYIAETLNMNSLLEYTSEAINNTLVLSGYETIDFSNKYIYEADEVAEKRLLLNLKKELLIFVNNHSLYNYNDKKVLKRKIISFPKKNKDI